LRFLPLSFIGYLCSEERDALGDERRSVEELDAAADRVTHRLTGKGRFHGVVFASGPTTAYSTFFAFL